MRGLLEHSFGVNPFFNTVNIQVSPLCVENTDEPVKEHVRKSGMSYNYHRRVQKKWVKRFGYVKKPALYKTRGGFICHPDIHALLIKELTNHENFDITDSGEYPGTCLR